MRCITKKAQSVPEDYRRLVISWLQFNYRNSQPLSVAPNPNNWLETVLCKAAGHYDLSNICNLDETPLSFEYLNGRTYNPIGSKTVWVKETRSGWDKRQASLVLCIFADGVNRIPPMILFHDQGAVYAKESPQYHPGVLVEFNETAYMNDNLFLKYIQHQITSTMIPGGCTGLIQPLDVSVNKPLKARIRDLTDEAILECESFDHFEKWSVGQRRIMTTWCVGDAWYAFCIEKQDLVKRVFRKVGLSLPIDGSADHELDIKGFCGIDIGDWTQVEGSNEEDTQLADVNMEHDNYDLVEFVADGE